MSQLPAISLQVDESFKSQGQAGSLNCAALYGVTCSLYLHQEWEKKSPTNT